MISVEKNRTTPDNITKLNKNQVFVFGSNQAGRHGKGAAKTALGFGAKPGQATGLQGNSYGIPTKDRTVRKTLSLAKISEYVSEFITFAENNKHLTFLVTEIGCGLARLHPKDIGPLFQDCSKLENVYLPKRFWKYIK